MKLNQISVFLEDKKGRLFEVCSVLGEGGINIRALTIAESRGYGVARMVVDKPDAAMDVLKGKGFVAEKTEIVAVQVADRPGGLANILKILYEKDVNVEYMYGFVEKFSDKALMVFRFENPDEGLAVLSENGVKVLGTKDIVNL
ncbi:MAG: ACT domain-containing protein [Phycisphaerae bacterium]|nr:ACT domain-containing protein [Phycisphaerae bacterium]